MFIPFGIVLGIGIIFIFLATRWARQSRRLRRRPEEEAPIAFQFVEPATAFRPSPLDQPCRWLAIKSTSPAMVQLALGLHHPASCSWEEGIVESRSEKMFISPPINGWVLVFGATLPDPADDVDECYLFLTALSRKLGHVQFYNTNRVLTHHAWALLEEGEVYRGYAWTGETAWNQGSMTGAEKELDLRCYQYGSERSSYTLKDSLVANGEKVHRLAAQWSLDPTAVTEAVWNSSLGILGLCPQFKSH